MNVIKKIFRSDLTFFIFALLGALCGLLLALLSSHTENPDAFASGFAHAFPGVYTPRSIAFAVFFQALPMLIVYYSGYGILVRETAATVIFIRAFFGGYCALFAARLGDLKDPLFLLLFVFFILFELLTLSFHASFAHLARAFSRAILTKRAGKAVKSYTADLLFFSGLILFFYIARGCVVALMNL